MSLLQNSGNFLGRIFLASYFIKAGINNCINFKRLVAFVTSKHIPLPMLSMFLVVVVQILGGLALVFNYCIVWAASALIAFTIAANLLICNYWKMQGNDRRNINFLFYANIAVIGGLLIVIFH